MTSTDITAKARAIAGTADNLRANRHDVTRKVNDWAGTLARSGDGGPTSHGDHSDPTCSAALAVDPMRDIDARWRKALTSAAGWSRHVLDGDCPTDLAAALTKASRAITAGGVGMMYVTRLYASCCKIDDIIGECRPTLDEPVDNTPTPGPRTCVACISEHQGNRPECDPCRKLHQRNPEHDDDDFATWVQRRIVEGTLSRPTSALHQERAA